MQNHGFGDVVTPVTAVGVSRWLRHVVGLLTFALVAGVYVLAEDPGSLPAGAARSPSSAPTCTRTQLMISLGQRIPSMSGFAQQIMVQNTGRHTCTLAGQPSVELYDTAGRQFSVITTSGSIPSPAGATDAGLPLAPREVATSVLLVSSSTSGMPQCSLVAARYAITFPSDGDATRTFDGPLPNCANVTIQPLLAGFDGSSSGGQVKGTAPTCAAPSSGKGLTPYVLISVTTPTGNIVSGSGTPLVLASPKVHEPFFVDLPAGHYTVHSGTQTRKVVIRLGFASNLGIFGTCTTSSSVPTTGNVGSGPTTSTTR